MNRLENWYTFTLLLLLVDSFDVSEVVEFLWVQSVVPIVVGIDQPGLTNSKPTLTKVREI